MPEYTQPNPEAWDDDLAGYRRSPDLGDVVMGSVDGGPSDGPSEYTSGDAVGVGDGATAASVEQPADRAGQAGSPAALRPDTTPSIETTLATEADEGSAFLADLARAMQAAAEAERARSLEDTDRRRQESLAEIRQRAAAEATELGQLAEAEIAEVGAWAESEMERIRLEKERRIEARRDKLQRRIDDHGSITDRQVEAVEDAVLAYRSELGRFFDRLEDERDPSAIARLARTRPAFPPLEVVAGRARTAAAADALGDEPPAGNPDAAGIDTAQDPPLIGVTAQDPPLIGVMDRDAGSQPDPSPWTAAPAEPVETPAVAAEAESASAETAPTESGITPRSSGSLLGTVPVLRPIGAWLNREPDAERPVDRD